MTPGSEGLFAVRAALVTLGVGLLLVGAVVFLKDVNPGSYVGVAAWLAGAIVLHDGIAAMAVFGVTVLVRRADGIPFVVRAIVQGGAAVGVLIAVLVVPEIVKRAIGTANPSILPLDYVGNLLLVEAGLAVATVLAIAVALSVRASRRTRASR